MARLIYMTNTSLDGYIEDKSGAFDWENPEQLHPLIIQLLRPVGTYLYGRRLYEKMAYWDAPVESYAPEYRAFARIWQKPGKIVYSRTLTVAATRNTRVEHDFDADVVRDLKQKTDHDITIGGAELAGVALEADLVDECHLFVHPVLVGGGKPAFPADVRRKLELLDTHRIGTSVMHLHYRVKASR